MYKRLGYLAAGIVVGALITGYLVNNEIRSKMDEKEPEKEAVEWVLKDTNAKLQFTGE